MEKADTHVNWANDFGVNEMLHFLAQKISAKYGHLYMNNETHPNANEWNKRGIEWSRFDRSIKDLVLNTREEAENMIDTLTESFKEAERIEMDKN